jgi:hypothetical protein
MGCASEPLLKGIDFLFHSLDSFDVLPTRGLRFGVSDQRDRERDRERDRDRERQREVKGGFKNESRREVEKGMERKRERQAADPVLTGRLLSSFKGLWARKAISGGRLPCIIFADWDPMVTEACWAEGIERFVDREWDCCADEGAEATPEMGNWELW